jgi:photosynthetic reaction center H subunit
MGTGAITGYFDVAQLVLYLFWIFFAGLIYYLVRENRREGYPLETHAGTRHEGWVRMPSPKTYELEDGSTRTAPSGMDPVQTFSGERVHGHEGSPIEPVGNPLNAGVGPGAWAQRPDHAELDHHGVPKIRPLAATDGCDVSEKDPDPRGMTVLDANGDAVGTVRELWLDVPEMIFRYLELELADGSRRVMVPMAFARVTRDAVKVHALLAPQYAGVPGIRGTDRITLQEEERICAYFGGGLLYAEPSRAEPLV